MAKKIELPAWQEEPISHSHHRKNFDCGHIELNTYLARFARQNHQLGVSKTFVIVTKEIPKIILGYYSLSACQISIKSVPDRVLKRVGHYPIPVVMLGRLAVDRHYQGFGLGGILLLSAGERILSVSKQVGIRAMVMDAKNEPIARWYERFGAVRLKDQPLSLILPLEVIKIAIRNI